MPQTAWGRGGEGGAATHQSRQRQGLTYPRINPGSVVVRRLRGRIADHVQDVGRVFLGLPHHQKHGVVAVAHELAPLIASLGRDNVVLRLLVANYPIGARSDHCAARKGLPMVIAVGLVASVEAIGYHVVVQRQRGVGGVVHN